MNLVLGVIFIWLGAALIYVAVHGLESAAATPFAVWQEILRDVTGGGPNG